MSRQFDEYMEDKFEYQGELKSLIEPTSFSELVSALNVRDTLQAIIDFAMREEDTSGYEELKVRQNDYIQEYLNSRRHTTTPFLAMLYITSLTREATNVN